MLPVSTTTHAFTPALLSLDTIGEPPRLFQGYTNGQAWNSHTVPFFAREVAEQIGQEPGQQGGGMRYDEESDSFFVRQAGRWITSPRSSTKARTLRC